MIYKAISLTQCDIGISIAGGIKHRDPTNIPKYKGF